MSLPDYTELVEQIAEQTGVVFRATSPSQIAKLEALGVPESVIAFYREFEPAQCAQGQVRLWPIENILEENEAYVPVFYASKYGYVVFATTICGDAYCFDISSGNQIEPRIVLLSHEMIHEDSTAADITALAKPVATDLHDFLSKFVRGEVDEECIYE